MCDTLFAQQEAVLIKKKSKKKKVKQRGSSPEWDCRERWGLQVRQLENKPLTTQDVKGCNYRLAAPAANLSNPPIVAP